MTPEPKTQAGTATDASEGKPRATSWSGLRENLKNADGERHEFFPLQQVEDGQSVTLTLIGEPVFDQSAFHGKFSMFEVDVRQGTTPYRLCVSGARLAKALADLEPAVGTVVTLTAKGPSGRERKWTATKKTVVVATQLNHAS